MPETTKETLDRLARTLRAEAAAVEAKQTANGGVLQPSKLGDRDYQKGRADGLRESAHLLDEKDGS